MGWKNVVDTFGTNHILKGRLMATLKGTDRPRRTRDVEQYLAKAGVRNVILVKGPGFFCFEGTGADGWVDHTARVTFLTDLTLDEWLQKFRSMDSASKESRESCNS